VSPLSLLSTPPFVVAPQIPEAHPEVSPSEIEAPNLVGYSTLFPESIS